MFCRRVVSQRFAKLWVAWLRWVLVREMEAVAAGSGPHAMGARGLLPILVGQLQIIQREVERLTEGFDRVVPA